MTELVTTTDRLFATHHAHRVFVRERWEDEWEEIEHLYANWIEFAAGPEISRAELVWRYGVGMPAGERRFAQYTPRELNGWYVSIEVEQPEGQQPIVWFGVVKDTADNRHGAPVVRDERIPTGIQSFLCFGLEAELDRVRILKSIVRVTDPSPGELEIERAIAFNVGQGNTAEVVAGNSTKELVGAHGTKIFAEALHGFAEPWTAPEILEYLLAYYAPTDKDETAVVPFVLAGQTEAIAWHEPRLEVHGRTLREILNQLVDRRRAVSYRVQVNSYDQVEIRVFSLAESAIALPSGATLPANAEQRTLDFDRAFDVLSSTVRTSAAHVHDQIVCRGARRLCCFTVSFLDGTLDIDWTTADQSKYDGAARLADELADPPPTPRYADLSAGQKQTANDRFRSSDELERVYAWFRLPGNWDGMAGDGIGGTKFPVCPVLDSAGEPSSTEGVPLWNPGLQLESRLPLRVGHDYSGTALEGTPPHQTPDGSLYEPVPVFAALKVDGTANPPKYQYAEKLRTEKFSPEFAYGVRVQDHGCGLVLRCNPPERQHMLAKDTFVPTDDTDEGNEAVLDYRDNLLATVALLADAHVEARHPADADLPEELDYVRRLEIDVPKAYLDWVAPGTVVSISNGELQRSTSGGFLRDDRPRLKDLARVAFAWYGTERRLFELTYRQISGLFQVGNLITAIGRDETLETINTVITSVRIDLLQGTTTVKTQFSELDVAAL
jgi:hypothetical protein